MGNKFHSVEDVLEEIRYQMTEGCSDAFSFLEWLEEFIDEQLFSA